MKTPPCNLCLTLPICAQTGVCTGGVSKLSDICDVLSHYIYEPFDVDRFYETYHLMKNVIEGKYV